MPSIQSYLIAANDSYAPAVSKSSLQQYDNYQIHDLYCDDIEYRSVTVFSQVIPAPSSVKFKNFLAVERVSPFGEIPCDFETIAKTYS